MRFFGLLLRGAVYSSIIEERKEKEYVNLIVKEIRKEARKGGTFRIVSHVILKDIYGFTHMIDHIIITTTGVFAITECSIKNIVDVSKSSMTWKYKNGEKEEEIYNPYITAMKNADEVNGFINNFYNVHPIVVFLRNNLKDKENPPIINLASLSEYITTYRNEHPISRDNILSIYKMFLSYIKRQPSLKEHLDNMKRYYSTFKEGRCPYCNASINKQDEHFRCSSCSKLIF